MAWSNLPMRFVLSLLAATLAVTGCVSKSKSNAQARAAYMAGQQAAYQSMGGTITDVVILGDVQKHEVPWVDGLTLAQALATANYLGSHDPQDIVLKRNSVETEINPKDLLNGQDVELKPGDQISVVGN
jgi:cation transport ATPase